MIAPVNWSSPVNWNNSLNHGLISWWLNVPHWQGGTTAWFLVGRNDGTLTLMDPANDWLSNSHPGGFGSLNFDGSNDYVSVPDSDDLDIGTSDFSISAWANKANSAQQRLVMKRQSAVGYELFVDATDKPTLFIGDSVGFTVITAPAGISLGTWHFIVLTFDRDGNGTIYVDGINVKVSSISTRTGSLTGTTGLYFGAFNNEDIPVDNNFLGSLDDIRIYNRVLSAAEVSDYHDLSQQGYPGVLNRRGRRGVGVAAVEDLSHVAALAGSYDNVVQRRPIKVTNF